MKRLLMIGMTLAFALGIAGFSLASDKAASPMKHDDVKICANTNCCGAQPAKGAYEEKKTDEEKWREFHELGKGG